MFNTFADVKHIREIYLYSVRNNESCCADCGICNHDENYILGWCARHYFGGHLTESAVVELLSGVVDNFEIFKLLKEGDVTRKEYQRK